VIVGDANMAEISTYLKMGTMAIVLSMVEDDFITSDLSIDGPVGAFRKVSRDLAAARRSGSRTGAPSAPSTTSASSWSWPSANFRGPTSTSRGCAT